MAAPVEPSASSVNSSDSESEQGENWILAEVTDYSAQADTYDIDDIGK